MVRKGKAATSTSLTVTGTDVGMPGMLAGNPIQEAAFDLTSILKNPDLTPAQRRKMYWEAKGLKGKKSKYASPAERKAANKARSKERRTARIASLPEELRPRAKVKRSPEEKKERRKERGKEKREFLREMAQKNPELASRYGIHVDLFKANRPKREKKAKKK